MRIAVFLFIVCLGGFLLFRVQNFHATDRLVPPTAPTSTPTPSNLPSSVVINNTTYAYSIVEISDISQLHLIPNWDTHVSAQELRSTHNCSVITSGGFYDTNDQPLGLVIQNSKESAPYRQSSLFDGIFSISSKYDVYISRQIPEYTPRLAVQSGPIVYENAKPTLLAIRNDESARRVVVGITASNTVVLIALYSPDNTFSGPFLEQVPQMINRINADRQDPIVQALNLDGGSASAFLTPQASFHELTPIGMALCVKRG